MINPLDLEWDRISPKVGSTFLKSVLTQKTLRSILQDVDKSFVKSKEASYRFINDEDIVVEIITPITSVEQSNDSFSGVLNPDIDVAKWLGEHERKDYMKKQRDIKQSLLVTKLIQKHMPLIEIDEELKSIKNMSLEAIKQYRNEVLLAK